MSGFSLADLLLVVWYIGVLAFLEGLLSADNAIVLALMVRHLPKGDQRRVLLYGIWGAVLFRFVALLLSAILLKFWYFKVIGGGYLLYLAIAHFLMPPHDDTEPAGGSPNNLRSRSRRLLKGFWGTVVSVTLTDIAFSIDSILAAVSLAVDFPERFGENGKFFVVFVGGVLGIITMRFVVRYFLMLLERFPGLAAGAYVLVAWIGLKLLISGFHQAEYNGRNILEFQMSEWLFWTVMVLIAAVSFIVGRGPRPGGPTDVSRGLDAFDDAQPPAPGAAAKVENARPRDASEQALEVNEVDPQ